MVNESAALTEHHDSSYNAGALSTVVVGGGKVRTVRDLLRVLDGVIEGLATVDELLCPDGSLRRDPLLDMAGSVNFASRQALKRVLEALRSGVWLVPVDAAESSLSEAAAATRVLDALVKYQDVDCPRVLRLCARLLHGTHNAALKDQEKDAREEFAGFLERRRAEALAKAAEEARP